MTPRVNVEDLIDSRQVAQLLGLSQSASVFTYLRRYPDMPRPVVGTGTRQTRLWVRQQIETWAKKKGLPRTKANRDA